MRISDWSSDVCSSDLTYVKGYKDDYAHIRDVRAGKGQSVLHTLEEARANYYDAYLSDKPAPPLQPGLHRFDDWSLEDLRACIDWTHFFSAWDLHGTYPAILDHDDVGQTERALKADADTMLTWMNGRMCQWNGV